MSRVIKFRAWDGANMTDDVCPWRWDFVITKNWHKCTESNGPGLFGSGGTEGTFEVPGKSFKEVMQFTGLSDKNGIEIFEGDIVERSGHKYTVKYMPGSFVLAIGGRPVEMSELIERYTKGSAVAFYFEGLTVLGNIYQNPELLAQSDKP